MNESNRCRIGRVRFKSGAEMRVLDTPPPNGEPEVVKMLLDLLVRARSGSVIAVAMVAVSPKGTVSTGWCEGRGPNHHQLASGAATLLCRIGGN